MSTLKEIMFYTDYFIATVETPGGTFEVKGKYISDFPLSRVEIGEGGKYFIGVEDDYITQEHIMNAVEEISDNWWRSWENGKDIKKVK